MDILYWIVAVGMSLSLVGWQLWGEQKNGAWGGVITYLFILGYFIWMVNSDLSMYVKSIFIAKDLFIAAFFTFIARNIGKVGFLKIPIFLLLGVVLFYTIKWTALLTPLLPHQTNQQDNHIELLAELIPGTESAFIEYANGLGLEVQTAFQMEDTELTVLDDFYTINIPNNQLKNYDDIVARIKDQPQVTYLEENELIQLDTPSFSSPITSKSNLSLNDPLNTEQWGLQELLSDDFYKSIKKIKPKDKPLLAILDTGVDSKHEDLDDNYVSIELKSDKDNMGHGTHCAGIAGAVSNNKKGISSMNSNGLYNITSVKVLNGFGGGTQQMIINGMLKATDAGADVISMSLGGRSNDRMQKAYSEAVAYANKHGAIVVVAAGNSGGNAKNYSPANADGVIAVSAIDQNMQLASFSNHTTDIEMGIAAPGVNIMSCMPNNEYKPLNGTSMATPFVASMIAILKAYKPNISTKESFELLNETASIQSELKVINPKKILDGLDI